jgi:hypothetical protein
VKRWRVWVLVALLAWMLVVTWWAMQPVTDSVDTGVVRNAFTSQTVQCDSPLSGNTKPTEPLPPLHGTREYQRTPCKLPIENGRLIFWVDVAFALIGVVILAKTWKASAPADSIDDVADAPPISASS